MTTRRHVLAGMLAASLPRLSWADAGGPTYLAAAQDKDGSQWLHGLSDLGESRFRLALPARGHAAAAHPGRPEAVAFARRPGTFALVIDCARGTTVARLAPPEGRQFNGHGVFSHDGAVLYTSEVVADTSEGRLGIWDAEAGYARVGEVATGGIGPHDVKRLSGGGLVVANGGIRTDPSDRTKLNIETMRSNLCYLSAAGEILEQVELDEALHQNSIRHLALGPDGMLAFAMQWEGDPTEPVPLLGLHRRGQTVQLCPARDEDALAMQGYAGSIAMDAGGRRIGLTSSHGGVVMIFDADGAPLTTIRRQDVSGIAAAAEGFIVTDGLGAVSACNDLGLRALQRQATAWDNHLIRIV